MLCFVLVMICLSLTKFVAIVVLAIFYCRLMYQVHEAQNDNVRLRIQHARNYAVSQAQKDGCTGNFKVLSCSCDSNL